MRYLWLPIMLLVGGPALAAPCDTPLLRAAIDRAGGRFALERAATLHWEGSATILGQAQPVEIGMRTTIVPFRYARSDTWLVSEGPDKLRSLVIVGTRGWIERGGSRSPMPLAMLRHEQAQYALYGLMRLIPLCQPAAIAAADAGARTIRAIVPGAPPTTLIFDTSARLIAADNQVPAPDGHGTVTQHFAFEGDQESFGVHWPRLIRLDQDGRPAMVIRLDRFSTSRQLPPEAGR